MKKITLLTLTTSLFAISLTSCGGAQLINPNYQEEGVHIGILKFAADPPLNDAEDGFIERLNQEGITYNYETINCNANIPDANSYALSVVSNYNLVFGIATPAAQALQAARSTKNRRIPMVFTAVTDPVSSRLVSAFDKTTGNITGTTDDNPVEQEIQLFKDINPNIDKIGVVYNVNEPNSEPQVQRAHAKCDALGITFEDGGFDGVDNLPATIDRLITNGIKGLYLPTDTTVVTNFKANIKPKTDTAKILVVAGEASPVYDGAIASRSLSYKELGRTTAEQVIQIINGTNVSNIPVTGANNFPLIINKGRADALQINIPQTLLDEAAEVIE